MKRLLFLLLLGAAYSVKADLQTDLVSCWKFDETSGTRSDGFGSYNLSDNGSAGFGTGKINNAVNLNGSSQYLSHAGVQIVDAFSVSFWFKATSLASDYHAMFSRRGGGDPQFIQIYINTSNKLAVYMGTTAGTTTSFDGSGSTTFTTGTWYHVVVTYSTSTGLIAYVNGSSDATASATTVMGTATEPLNIGRDISTSGRFFDGLIDEVGVWNRALTSGEVTSLYASGSAIACPFGGGPTPTATATATPTNTPTPTPTSTPGPTGGPLVCWKFDESSGNAVDSIGAITLTNANGATFVSGLINNAGRMTQAASSFFYCADATALRFTTPFTVSAWVKFNSLSVGTQTIISKFSSSALEFELTWDVSDTKFKARLFGAGGNAQVEDTHIGTLSTGTWYNVVVTNDGTNMTIRTNNGTSDSVSSAGVGTVGGTSAFSIGSSVYFGVPGSPLNTLEAQVDEVGKWDRVLSSGEITQLYNSGAGLACPFSLPTPTPTPTPTPGVATTNNWFIFFPN